MRKEIPVYDISNISALHNDEVLISRFGPYSRSHKHLHYPHRHNFYHVVLFNNGTGTHSIDFETFEVKAWQIYFMVPGQVHSWDFSGEVEGYVVNFSASYFQSFLLHADYLQKFIFFQGIVSDSVLEIPTGSRHLIQQSFEDLLGAYQKSGKYSNDLLRLELLKIFINISELVRSKSEKYMSTYNYTLLRNFQQLVEQNYTHLKLPREYAALLYVTPNHLNSLCNDLLDISAGELIRRRIILEAKRLLVNLDITITEISRQLNFKDNSYFSKFFRKYVGLTPEEFRKSALNS